MSGLHIRDAEMSVDFLCHKFEALSEQLRREENAREAEDQRCRLLTSEVESAEEAIAKNRNSIALELSAKDSVLAGLRASATGTGQRVATQATRVNEEQAMERRLGELCGRLAAECKEEASMADSSQARIASHDREIMQEQRDRGELGRKMRSAQADTRVVQEDLLVAQQRGLLVQGQQQALQRSFSTTSRSYQEYGQACEAASRSLHDKHLQAADHEQRIKALRAALEAARSDNTRREQRLACTQEEEMASQAQFGALRQEHGASQLEAQTRSSDLQLEMEAVSAMQDQLQKALAKKAVDLEEIKLQRVMRDKLEGLRTGAEEARRIKAGLTQQLSDALAEEQREVSSASGLRHLRYQEDMASEDVQTELQVALKKHEALTETLSLQSQGRDAVSVKLRRLQPEFVEAENRCHFLEDQLAQRSRQLEAELVEQRTAQQEALAVSDAVYELQRHEVAVESDLRGASPFLYGASPEHDASPPNGMIPEYGRRQELETTLQPHTDRAWGESAAPAIQARCSPWAGSVAYRPTSAERISVTSALCPPAMDRPASSGSAARRGPSMDALERHRAPSASYIGCSLAAPRLAYAAAR